MESGFSDEQETIQATSHVFWTVQFTGNILKNNKQHI